MIYNVQKINYLSGYQIRLYECPVVTEKTNTEKIFKSEFYKKSDKEKEKHYKNTSNNRTKKKVYEYARANEWQYFLTMTFNDSVNRYNFDECVKKMSDWIYNIKRTNTDLYYIFVPEQHKDGAWHFHALVNNLDLPLVQAVNPYTGKKIEDIYNLPRWKNGFTTVSKIKSQERVSSYITKYITKSDDIPKGRKRYWVSRNCKLPTKEFLEVVNADFEMYCDEKMTFCKVLETPYNQVTYIERMY